MITKITEIKHEIINDIPAILTVGCANGSYSVRGKCSFYRSRVGAGGQYLSAVIKVEKIVFGKKRTWYYVAHDICTEERARYNASHNPAINQFIGFY